MNALLSAIQPANTEVIVVLTACLGLLQNLFLGDKWPRGSYLIALGGLVLAFFSIDFSAETHFAYHNLMISDMLAHLLQAAILIAAFVAFVYSRLYVDDRNLPRGEYYVLGLFSVVGMLVLVAAHSLLTVYLGLELLSLPLYAMVGMQRDNANATEAAMKYFVMGAIASGMMLYGMSIIYGVSGGLDFAVISKAVGAQQSLLLATFGLVFIVVGIGFKLATVPFHMWAPDVYSGAPSSVTLFLATAPKLAAVGMMFRLLLFALTPLAAQWQHILMVLAILSMGLGNLLAIAQTNIKRMLAYSAIAHMGYMLLGLIAGNDQGYSAATFYILNYALMSLAAFGMVVLMSRAGFEAENIQDFAGLNARSPWLAMLMMIVMFSMAGIPPTVGFFAKLLVLKSLVDANLIWLAALALGFTIWGAYYYLCIIKTLYFDEPKESAKVVLGKDTLALISINSIALVGLGLFPGALWHLCRLAFGG